MDDVKEPVEPSSTEPGVEATPPVAEPEEATSQEAVQQEEVQTVPYDRFREVNEEKKYYQKLVEQLASRQTSGETQKQVEQDPYANMSAEEAHFYRNLDARNKRLIQEEAKRLADPIVRQNQVLARQVSQMMERDFRKSNTDVVPNSEEEQKIANYISMGMTPDDAAWAVMGKKRLEAERVGKAKQQQKKVEQKIKANLETNSIPNGSPISQKKLSFREELDAKMQEAGL